MDKEHLFVMQEQEYQMFKKDSEKEEQKKLE